MKLTKLAATAMLCLSTATTASAIPDHLQCSKIKDDIAKTNYTATITPDDPTFPAAAGCQIKLGAKLLCVDATKSAVVPTPPGTFDGAQPGKFFCYKAKCPVTNPAFTGVDQFGTHNIEVKKTQFLCAPVDTVPPTTTTLPECIVAGDCPGMDTQCQQRTCVMNNCGFSNAMAGIQLMSQTSGDCQTAICDGMGGITNQVNNSDVPVDGNDCTDDVCTAGVPSNPVKPLNSACASGGGTFCSNAGTCVECNSGSQCPGVDNECQTRSCSANTCGFTFQPNGTPCTMGGTQCNGTGSCL